MIELPDVNDVRKMADWIELYVLLEGKSISKSTITAEMAMHLDEEDTHEQTIDAAIKELYRRLPLYGNKAPYFISRNVVSPKIKWRKYPELILCLLFSTYGAQDAHEGTKLFEEFTKSCIDFFLASGSVIVGYPTKQSFKQRLDILAKRCNEKRGDDPQPMDKDRGVDIVAWKTFNDTRNSNVYILIQCAAGANWKEKFVMPCMASWRRYINWNVSTVIPAISIPQIIKSEDWPHAVDNHGFIMDRARLFRTITSPGYETNEQLKNKITAWCQSKLEK